MPGVVIIEERDVSLLGGQPLLQEVKHNGIEGSRDPDGSLINEPVNRSRGFPTPLRQDRLRQVANVGLRLPDDYNELRLARLVSHGLNGLKQVLGPVSRRNPND